MSEELIAVKQIRKQNAGNEAILHMHLQSF